MAEPNEPSSPGNRMADEMLTEDEVAAILKVSRSWLAKRRMRRQGPPFIKLGRSVRYFPLGPWIDAQRRRKH
jgi:predicted DNA-binding transcriptional regulator AlpA